jgi:uncharacterized NAD(P)/FAD-binding protein YdhS
MRRPVIGIIGAGLSGALTALNVIKAEGERPWIHLLEKGPRFGRGAAYATPQPDHLLNVRAANMSADPDEPDQFITWLREHGDEPAADGFSFASRGAYGAYIQHLLRRTAQRAGAVGRLDLTPDEVVAVEAVGDGFVLRLAMGRTLAVDAVVLATGNNQPGIAALPDPAFAAHRAYVGDPWSPGALESVEPDDPVLLIGTGLTMVDVVASLDARGHRGPLFALSRRGLKPRRHEAVTAPAVAWTRGPLETLAESLRRFRHEAARSGDWRTTLDSLRPNTQALWRAMSGRERRRFLNHLRPWWDVHRHRLAPAVADRLDGWIGSGRLRLEAGRLVAIDDDQGLITVSWRPRSKPSIARLSVRHVVNCSGPEGDPRRSNSPLLRNLLEAGLIRPDPYGLGVDAAEDGRLLGADGRPHSFLFGVGPITRGALWEIVAVPDIRIEAQRLGRRLASLTRNRRALMKDDVG